MAAGIAGCGEDEPRSDDPPASTTTTTAVVTTETSSLETVSAVLASRLRGEYPGVRDTHVTVDGIEMRLDFEIGTGETPGDAGDLGRLAVEELQYTSPDILEDVTTVTVHIEGPTSPATEETFVLHGQLLPIP